jgi:hypothetical protein
MVVHSIFCISYAHDGIKALADYFMAKYVLQVKILILVHLVQQIKKNNLQDGVVDRNSLKDIAEVAQTHVITDNLLVTVT